ncbi:MAG: hypothetical protein IIY16_01970, partial [Oscillospiraceae bacterium]|nr:hypothetical protein [Oscillospiraceae bacterium]
DTQGAPCRLSILLSSNHHFHVLFREYSADFAVLQKHKRLLISGSILIQHQYSLVIFHEDFSADIYLQIIVGNCFLFRGFHASLPHLPMLRIISVPCAISSILSHFETAVNSKVRLPVLALHAVFCRGR